MSNAPALAPSLHPRPQLTRARWTDLGGAWSFGYDDANVGLDEGWPGRDDVLPLRIEVPYPPESPASGVGDRSFHPVVWYRREFDWVPVAGERLLLHFGAVDYRASVWVNGMHVTNHEGGHTPFSTDITPALAAAGRQVVVVRAEDVASDLAQPRGKQDWRAETHSIFYERTTGIWQPVWLEPVPATYVRAVRWTPDLARGVLGCTVEFAGVVDRPLRLRIRLRQHGEEIADDTYSVRGGRVEREIALHRPDLTLDRRRRLWSPEHPNLVDAELTLLADDQPLDELRSYAGLRSVGTADGRFLLNGRPYVLRLVLEQGYWPQSHLAAPDADALRREVELVKELGFNGVRVHQKVEDPRFLYWCDRLGLVVWGEMANAYEFSRAAVERVTREWLEVLDRDYSVPSIVAWVPVNESWGVPSLTTDPAQRHLVRALYSLTKALDGTRLVIGNDGWEHGISDVVTVHDYAPDGETLRERYGSREAVERTLREVQPYFKPVLLPEFARTDEPLMITEFGGITLVAGSEAFWNGYGAVADADELLKRYDDLVSALVSSPAVAGFCYTQLTDTVQERNGLLTEDRTPKADVAALRAITTGWSAAVPGEAIFAQQAMVAEPPPALG